MSKILREAWSFDQNSDLEPYKLGQVIDFNKELSNFVKSTEGEFDFEYIGNENHLWIVTIVRNVIVRLIYKQNFPFPSFSFWENHYDKITSYLAGTSKRVDENYRGDKINIVFRDGFVTLIILNSGIDK